MFVYRGETRALIGGGGGGGNIHIFLFCPTNVFSNQLSLRLISKEIRRAEHEYMNIHPPPPINALVSPLFVYDVRRVIGNTLKNE